MKGEFKIIKKKICMVFISLAIFLVVSLSVQAVDMGINYKLDGSKDISTINALGVSVKSELENDMEMEFFIGGTTNFNIFIFISDIEGYNSFLRKDMDFLMEIEVYKKVSENGYFVGGEYKYLYDYNSNYKTGGLLLRDIYSIKYKKEFELEDDITLTAELGVGVLGSYNFMGQEKDDYNSWEIEVDVEQPLEEDIDLVISGSYGKEQYKDINSDKCGFSIGVNFEI